MNASVCRRAASAIVRAYALRGNNWSISVYKNASSRRSTTRFSTTPNLTRMRCWSRFWRCNKKNPSNLVNCLFEFLSFRKLWRLIRDTKVRCTKNLFSKVRPAPVFLRHSTLIMLYICGPKPTYIISCLFSRKRLLPCDAVLADKFLQMARESVQQVYFGGWSHLLVGQKFVPSGIIADGSELFKVDNVLGNAALRHPSKTLFLVAWGRGLSEL